MLESHCIFTHAHAWRFRDLATVMRVATYSWAIAVSPAVQWERTPTTETPVNSVTRNASAAVTALYVHGTNHSIGFILHHVIA